MADSQKLHVVSVSDIVNAFTIVAGSSSHGFSAFDLTEFVRVEVDDCIDKRARLLSKVTRKISSALCLLPE